MGDGSLRIGDLLGLDHHMELATSLHGVGALDSFMGVRDLLELLKALDVGLCRLTTGTRTGGRDGIGRSHRGRRDRNRIDVGMVCLDGVHDLGALAVATGEVGATDGMRALDLVVDSLANVVEKAGTLGGSGIQAQLGGHDSAERGNLYGVREDVLAEGGAVLEGTEGLNDLWVEIMNARVESRLLTGLANALVDQVLGLLVELLDAGGVNATVSDEVLERHTRSLATDGVKAGEDNGLGRVINDEGDTGDLLERADVPTFSTDDAAP